jgi:hypothetical protein
MSPDTCSALQPAESQDIVLLFGGEGHVKPLPLHLLAKLETFITFFSAIILQDLPNPRYPCLQTVIQHYILQNG